MLEACKQAGNLKAAERVKYIAKSRGANPLPVLCTALHLYESAEAAAATAAATDDVAAAAAAAAATAAGGGGGFSSGSVPLVRANGWDVPEESRLVQALVGTLSAAIGWQPSVEALPLCFSGHNRNSQAELERSLIHHAEKKVLALLLSREASVLAMTVNTRVCTCCHTFFKAASSFFMRTITVTDPSFEHSFRGGVCSCADRWR